MKPSVQEEDSPKGGFPLFPAHLSSPLLKSSWVLGTQGPLGKDRPKASCVHSPWLGLFSWERSRVPEERKGPDESYRIDKWVVKDENTEWLPLPARPGNLSMDTHPCWPPQVPFQIIPPGGRIEPRIEFSAAVCQIHSAQWGWTLNTVNSAIVAARSMKHFRLNSRPLSAAAPLSSPQYSRQRSRGPGIQFTW